MRYIGRGIAGSNPRVWCVPDHGSAKRYRRSQKSGSCGMSVPKVAIVGRPNVGKSSLLNWLAGKLVSVVDPTAGVTRDRVHYLMNEDDRYFELVDTGGMGIIDPDNLTDEIEEQI